MRILRLALARCRALVRRDVIAGEICDEMRFHLEMRAEEYERQGLGAEDARRAATRRFGNLALMQDRGYDVRGGGVMETVLQDVRYGVRLLFRHRAFSLVAILTLGVGIGVSTALFSVIDAALLRPLPYPNSERLVDILVRETRNGEPHKYAPSLADIRAWRELGRIFAHVGSGRLGPYQRVIVEAGEPERLVVSEASEDFLEVYGVTPLLGRAIRTTDVREGGPLVALLGYGYWQSRFGGTPDVIGRVIRVAGVPTTIVGVLPAAFYRETALWLPAPVLVYGLDHRGSGASVRGRLRPGVTFVQAERELAPIAARVDPGSEGTTSVGVELTSLYDEETRGFGRTVRALAGAVGLILLIACVNVAGLLLARGAIREPELAIRSSIGAVRARLVRQLLTESLVLSLAGGLVGVVLAWTILGALVAIVPMSLPPNSPAAINLSVLAFTAVVSLVSAVGFGLLPALRVSRARVGAQLAFAGGRHGSRLSRGGGQLIIAAEVALAVVLLAGAGLMVRSFTRLLEVDVGYDPGAILTMEVEPVDATPSVLKQYYPTLHDAVRALPGVAAVGAIDNPPLGDARRIGFIRGVEEGMFKSQVLPGFFEAIGVPAKLGRLPAESDRTRSDQMVWINEQAAKLLFPNGGSPIGRYLHMHDEAPRQIIGIVGDVRQDGPRHPPKPEVYLLFGQTSPEPLRMVLRPHPSAMLSADPLIKMAQTVGPKVYIGRIQSGSDDLAENVVTPRNRTLLLSLLSGLGLLLALVGIFSMTAYAVARRTQEIGIRMACGAGPAAVVWTMVRGAVWPACLGLVVGIVGAIYATRVIASFLFQTTPHDPATFGAVALLMAGAALVAAWVPARRAARVDPVIALRAE